MSPRLRPVTAVLTLVTAVALGLTGCSSSGTGGSGGTDTPTFSLGDDDTPADAQFYAVDALQTAVDAIARSIGADDPQIVMLEVFPTYVIVQAIDPEAPDDLNEWTYRDGTVETPDEMDYGGDTEALEASLFPLSQVTPEEVVAFHDSALTRSKVEQPTIDNIVVQYDFDGRVAITTTVSGTSKAKTVLGDDDGAVTRVI